MAEFNFDHIFNGTVEEQRQKSAHFLHGLRRAREASQQVYAEAIVFGSSVSLFAVEKCEAAYKAFAQDRRSHELARLSVEVDREQAEKKLARVEELLVDLFKR